MTSDLLRRYKEAAEKAAAPSDESRQPLDYDACIDVETADGTRFGFRYQQLLWVRLRGNALLHLHFATHTVTVQGRSLDILYAGVLARTVARLVAERSRYVVDESTSMLITRVVVLQKPTPGVDDPEMTVEPAGPDD